MASTSIVQPPSRRKESSGIGENGTSMPCITSEVDFVLLRMSFIQVSIYSSLPFLLIPHNPKYCSTNGLGWYPANRWVAFVLPHAMNRDRRFFHAPHHTAETAGGCCEPNTHRQSTHTAQSIYTRKSECTLSSST